MDRGISGYIEPTDTDYFRISIPSTSLVAIYTASDIGLTGTLEDSDGSSLTTSQQNRATLGGFRIEHIVPPGDYYIRVSGLHPRIGPYMIFLTLGDDHPNSRAMATPILINSNRSGRISLAGDSDYFRIDVPSTEALVIYVATTDSVSMELLSATRSLFRLETIRTREPPSVRFLRDVSPGVYYFAMSGLDNTTTTYTVYASFDPHYDTRPRATLLNLNSRTDGHIEPLDVDYFRINVPFPGQLTISATSDVNLRGVLEDRLGNQVDSVQNSAADRSFTIGVPSASPQDYYFRVSIPSRLQEFRAGPYQIFTDFSVPSTPTIIGLTPSNGTIEVAWEAGNIGRETPVYRVVWTPADTMGRTSAITTISPHPITALENGTEYDVYITATNSTGGETRSSVMSAIPATTPGTPVITLTPQPDGESILIEWTLAEPGDAPGNIRYRVSWRADDTSAATLSTSGLTATRHLATDLMRDTLYQVTVMASNARVPTLVGLPSTAAARTLSPTAPSIPRNVRIRALDTMISVRWDEPLSAGIGDATISTYTVTWQLDGAMEEKVMLGAQITNYIIAAMNGGRYTVTVFATNNQGETGLPFRQTGLVPGEFTLLRLRVLLEGALQ